jgi:hypothetical protein
MPVRQRAGLLRLEGAAGRCAPQRGTRARRRSCACPDYRSILANVRANLNRLGGLRGDGLAGSLENQEQEGDNQTHYALIGGLGGLQGGDRRRRALHKSGRIANL